MIVKAGISVVGGKGGNGSVSFRREKFVAKGGPDGGDGGKGGDVYLIGREGVPDLGALRYGRVFSGEGGIAGSGGNRYGKAGKDVTVDVPVGTMVWEVVVGEGRKPIGEVVRSGEKLVVAEGGNGGKGNAKFSSPTNKVPYLAEEGESGERRDLNLEYWPLVDVAAVSLANAGKSQLLRAISRAFPEVTEYPFSTREPVFGAAEVGWQTFIVMEVPSLCSGAHEGKGLGNSFLTCLMRARLLLFLIDGTTVDAVADLAVLQRELCLHNEALGAKASVVAVNKIDLAEVAERLPELRRVLGIGGRPLHCISALTGEGIEALKAALPGALEGIAPIRLEAPPPVKRVRLPEPRAIVTRDGDVFVVFSPRAARIAAVADLRVFRARLQFRGELDKLGVLQALMDAGVKSGDLVRIGKVELEWQ